MVRLGFVFFAIDIILTVAALISCLSAEDEEIRGLPRIAWVLIILIFSPVGGIAWFLVGRESTSRRRGMWRPGNGFPEAERSRPLAPDDDPEFLRRVAEQQRQSQADDATLLRKWEEDLRRREDELRNKPDEPGQTDS